jgi:hypothetical protein
MKNSLLIVAAVAVIGIIGAVLAFQNSPVIISQTMTQTTTTVSGSYVTMALPTLLTYTTIQSGCSTQTTNNGNAMIVSCYSNTQTIKSPYTAQSTLLTPNTQTLSLTETTAFTNSEPLYSTFLGMNAQTFMMVLFLAIVAICASIYLMGRSKERK